MHDGEHSFDEDKGHGLRNFLLFALTCGMAWYFWKNRNPAHEAELIESQVAAPKLEPETKPDPVLDVAEIETLLEFEEELVEPEDLLEPALVDSPGQIIDDEPSTLEADFTEEIEAELEGDKELDELGNDEALADLLDFDDIRDRLEDALTTEDEDEYGESSEAEEDGSVEDKGAVEEPAAEGLEAAADETDAKLLPEADEPGVPQEPTWVKPIDGKCPEGFPIKARFSTGHFHEPGDRGYNKIVPDCCYPTSKDAESDGFTPSRWS